MKRITTFIIIVLILMNCAKKLEYRDPEWRVGEVVKYRVKSQDWGDYILTYSIFNKEGELFWVELKGVKDDSLLFIFQFLTPIYFKGKVKKQILKVKNTPPVLLEGVLAEEIPINTPLKIALKENLKEGKQKSIKISGKKFKTIAYIYKQDTLLVNPDVPITGIVKVRGVEDWELIDYSEEGAKSSIEEKPIKPSINF